MEPARNLLTEGLGLIVTSPNFPIETLLQRWAYVERHPLGLSVDCTIDGVTPVMRDLKLVACIGHTQPSVDGMRSIVLNTIKSYGLYKPFKYLRILQTGSYHYFEVGTAFGPFICGGCTSNSGTGGAGRTTLTTLFQYLSIVYGVPVENVVATQTDSKRMETILDDAWNNRGGVA